MASALVEEVPGGNPSSILIRASHFPPTVLTKLSWMASVSFGAVPNLHFAQEVDKRRTFLMALCNSLASWKAQIALAESYSRPCEDGQTQMISPRWKKMVAELWVPASPSQRYHCNLVLDFTASLWWTFCWIQPVKERDLKLFSNSSSCVEWVLKWILVSFNHRPQNQVQVK